MWVAEGCTFSHTRERRRREKGRRLRLISSVHFLCLQAGSSAALWSTHNIQFTHTLPPPRRVDAHLDVSAHCNGAILSTAPAASLFYSAAGLMRFRTSFQWEIETAEIHNENEDDKWKSSYTSSTKGRY